MANPIIEFCIASKIIAVNDKNLLFTDFICGIMKIQPFFANDLIAWNAIQVRPFLFGAVGEIRAIKIFRMRHMR